MNNTLNSTRVQHVDAARLLMLVGRMASNDRDAFPPLRRPSPGRYRDRGTLRDDPVQADDRPAPRAGVAPLTAEYGQRR
jgi:hypothetical protein